MDPEITKDTTNYTKIDTPYSSLIDKSTTTNTSSTKRSTNSSVNVRAANQRRVGQTMLL